jgi:predicted GTPase
MSESFGDHWFRDAFERSFQEEADRIGRFNLAIFGKTGVGKSTLVNAIFGEDIAATGIGEPVTPQEHLYLHRSGTLGVLDTRGLEIGRDTDVILRELGDYLKLQKSKPLLDQIHLAWYCVRAGDRRFEDAEAAFVRELRSLGLPVILVLTQVTVRAGVGHPDAVELARKIEALDLPIWDNRVFMTMAVRDDFAGSDAHGLEDLLDATFQAAPDGVEEAIAAAQQIDLAAKRASSRKAIQKAVAAAGAAGAAPIPFADAVVLVPIQMGMMAAVARIYGLTVDKAATATLAATVGATASVAAWWPTSSSSSPEPGRSWAVRSTPPSRRASPTAWARRGSS